jgi:YD repeat-containing protein
MNAKYLSRFCVIVTLMFSLFGSVVSGEEKSQQTLTTKHEYDKLNRLTRTTYSNGLYLAWAYDANGNIIRQASSTLLFPENITVGKQVLNLVVKVPNESDTRMIERLYFTTGKKYAVASPEDTRTLMAEPAADEVIKNYTELLRRANNSFEFTVAAVVLLPNK